MSKKTQKTPVEYELKHRLVGAFVIVFLFIVFVPAFLGESQINVETATKQQAVQSVLEQSTDTTGFVSAVKPIKTTNKETKSEPVLLEKKNSEQKPVEQGNNQTSSNEVWVLSVGVFIEPKNIQSTIEKLKKNGFSANTTKVKTDVGDATRVWLGPYADKKAAQYEGARLVPILGEKGYAIKKTW